mmetsp:Transcript_32046/g.75149  ORF Transcript_32046/g.75149 Transcript_32046/m.75149 type:complete len:274 (-) Transcript_32046:104-925(-)
MQFFSSRPTAAAQPAPPAAYPAAGGQQAAMPIAVAKAVPVQQPGPGVAAANPAALPVALATPVAAPATGSAEQPPPQKAVTQEASTASFDDDMPPAPSGFSELNRLGVPELQYMQANEQALDDWLLDLPQVRTYMEKLHDLREENAAAATSILDLEKELDGAAALHKSSCHELVTQRAVVEGLLQKRDEIMKQHSAEAYSRALEAQAQDADDAAENVLLEAMDQPGTLSGDALAQLRRSYVQHKVEKHWRLAAKERLDMMAAQGESKTALQCF